MTYPATFDVQTPEKMANWRPLVQWLLATPHLIVAYALQSLGGAVTFVSWFVILFTGKLPAGLADLQVMILRYSLRAQVYGGFLHDQFPPFSFGMTATDPGDTPMAVSYVPALEDRNRLTVGFRFILAIPAIFWVIIIGIVGGICWFFALFAVLFTGRWPAGLRDWAVKSLRVSNRFNAYAMLLTDEYPPFETD